MSVAQDYHKIQTYISGFDYLRAFACLFVVFWHFHMGQTVKYSDYIAGTDFIDLSEIVSLNLILLAVPVFMQLSLFLYLFKIDKVGYLKKDLLSY